MASANDSILLDQIRQGNQKALESLYEKYYYSLCDFACNYIKNTALAEEIVSDVFLAIWLRRESLSITSNFKSYLFVSVKNQSRNYIAQAKRLHEDISIADSLGQQTSADAEIRYTEFANKIESIMERLPEPRRTIFKLNRIEGLKYKEIAEIMSISVNTVQKQMVLAVKFISQFHPHIRESFIPLFLAFLFQ